MGLIFVEFIPKRSFTFKEFPTLVLNSMPRPRINALGCAVYAKIPPSSYTSKLLNRLQQRQE